MKVLHVFDHSLPLHSGYAFRSAAILREQRALGWCTFHVTSSKQGERGVSEESVDGLHFYRTPAVWLSKVPGADPLAVMEATRRRVLEVAKQVKPDLIHAHSPVLNVLPALRVGQRLSIPVVYEIRAFWEDAAVDHGTSTEGGMRYRLTRGLETYAVRKADHVFTICEGLRTDLVERGVSSDKITVIPNAVTVESFSQNSSDSFAIRDDLGLSESKVIGFIGSFYAYEGLDLLIDALPGMLRQIPNLKVLLVGGGPQESVLREKIVSKGLSERVIFTGRIPHEKVGQYYDLIDVLIYARLPMRLTNLVTPLKPLEAMAQKKLFVASDVGGHRELVRDGETGILFKAGDAAELAEKVVELLKSPDLWTALRNQGRQFVVNERTWEKSVSRYRVPYGRLLGLDR